MRKHSAKAVSSGFYFKNSCFTLLRFITQLKEQHTDIGFNMGYYIYTISMYTRKSYSLYLFLIYIYIDNTFHAMWEKACEKRHAKKNGKILIRIGAAIETITKINMIIFVGIFHIIFTIIIHLIFISWKSITWLVISEDKILKILYRCIKWFRMIFFAWFRNF